MEGTNRAMSTMDSSSTLTLVGAFLISLVGLIHLSEVPRHSEFAAYLGLLMAANSLGSLASAVGIYRGTQWGWPLGALVAGGAFVIYLESRTIGLPGLNEGRLDPPGILSLILEGVFVMLYLLGIVRRRAPGRG